MSTSRKRLLVRLALTVAVFASGCSALITVNVTGGWGGNLTWTTGPGTGFTSPFSLDLAQVEKDISGTITLIGRATETYTINITFGRATGSTVEFTASGVNDVIAPAVNVTFDFDGESDGTEMSGTGTANIDGNVYEFTWTATLVAPPPAEE